MVVKLIHGFAISDSSAKNSSRKMFQAAHFYYSNLRDAVHFPNWCFSNLSYFAF